MKIRQVAKQLQHSAMAFILAGAFPVGTLGQNRHAREPAVPPQLTVAQGELLKIVRENTERFKDVSAAEAEGYSLLFGCVSGPDAGAMGLHYVNLKFVASGLVDATRPQIIIYEPMPDGRLKLIGADFLVIASDWDKAHPGAHHSSWGNSITISKVRIGSAFPRSTHFTFGRGRKTPTGRS